MDTANKFWKKWINADGLKRENIIQQIQKHIEEGWNGVNTIKIPLKNKSRMKSQFLNSYFEDLYECACTNQQFKFLGESKKGKVSDRRRTVSGAKGR